MARRYYSSTAARTTLATGVDDTTTTLSVTAVSGWPTSFPYTLVIDQDTVNEELVEVSARSGTTLTVTRGVDGTSAVAHSAGAAVNHGVSARDFDEPNAFINGTGTVTETLLATGAVTSTKILDGTIVNADINASAAIAQSKIENLTSDLGAKLDTADLQSNRNLLYNGAMQVAQRGTSSTGITASGYYTADRWKIEPNSMGTWTQTVETDGPTGSGFTRSLKVLCTTADASPSGADYMVIVQRLEGQDVQRIRKGTAGAQQVTLSFWVKSNVTGTYVVELRDVDNSRHVSATYTVSASATWERKVITFPVDSMGVLDNDNNGSLDVNFWLGAGSSLTSGTLATTWASRTLANICPGQTNLAAATNNYWQITGVQLEVGDTATPFEFKSYGQELRECQRYYQEITTNLAGYNTTTQFSGALTYLAPMRATPTSVSVAAQGTIGNIDGGYAVTAGSFDQVNKDGLRVLLTSSAMTNGRAAISLATLVKVSAEL